MKLTRTWQGAGSLVGNERGSKMATLVKMEKAEPTPPRNISIDVRLTDFDAVVLERILSKVGGNPEHGQPRSAVDSMLKILRAAGYAHSWDDHLSLRVTGEITIN